MPSRRTRSQITAVAATKTSDRPAKTEIYTDTEDEDEEENSEGEGQEVDDSDEETQLEDDDEPQEIEHDQEQDTEMGEERDEATSESEDELDEEEEEEVEIEKKEDPSKSKTSTRAVRGGRKRSFPTVPASTSAAVSDEDGGSDDDEDDDDGSVKSATTKGHGTIAKRPKKINVRSVVTMSVDEMVQNCVYHFLISQHKKVPVKRTDLIRIAMNGQKKNFPEVMAEFDRALDEVFGMKVVGLEKEKNGKEWASYIVLSDYTYDVAEAVTTNTNDQSCKSSLLFLIICVIFMNELLPIDEDVLWNIATKMEFNNIVCKRREDFQKLLKSEYVTSQYLNMEKNKDSEHNMVRYSWGPRTEKEYSKGSILKYVDSILSGRQLLDFTSVHYNLVQLLEKDKKAGLVAAGLLADGENGSGLTEETGFPMGDAPLEPRDGENPASPAPPPTPTPRYDDEDDEDDDDDDDENSVPCDLLFDEYAHSQHEEHYNLSVPTPGPSRRHYEDPS